MTTAALTLKAKRHKSKGLTVARMMDRLYFRHPMLCYGAMALLVPLFVLAAVALLTVALALPFMWMAGAI